MTHSRVLCAPRSHQLISSHLTIVQGRGAQARCVCGWTSDWYRFAAPAWAAQAAHAAEENPMEVAEFRREFGVDCIY